MRYQPCNARELNDLAEEHQMRSDPRYRGDESPYACLESPPQNLMQLLAWCDELFPANGYPTAGQLADARALPENTTLRQVLTHLGADLSAYPAPLAPEES